MPLGKITKLTTTQRDLGLTKQPKYEVQKKYKWRGDREVRCKQLKGQKRTEAKKLG